MCADHSGQKKGGLGCISSAISFFGTIALVLAK